MLFNGGQFLTLFTVFITIYAMLYRNKTARTIYVLVFSFFFYYKASGWYLLILLLSILIDFFVAFLIYGSKTKAMKTFWLVLSVCANVGLLCYFKYTNFFIDNYNSKSFSLIKFQHHVYRLIKILCLKIILCKGVFFSFSLRCIILLC